MARATATGTVVRERRLAHSSRVFPSPRAIFWGAFTFLSFCPPFEEKMRGGRCCALLSARAQGHVYNSPSVISPRATHATPTTTTTTTTHTHDAATRHTCPTTAALSQETSALRPCSTLPAPTCWLASFVHMEKENAPPLFSPLLSPHPRLHSVDSRRAPLHLAHPPPHSTFLFRDPTALFFRPPCPHPH